MVTRFVRVHLGENEFEMIIITTRVVQRVLLCGRRRRRGKIDGLDQRGVFSFFFDGLLYVYNKCIVRVRSHSQGMIIKSCFPRVQ